MGFWPNGIIYHQPSAFPEIFRGISWNPQLPKLGGPQDSCFTNQDFPEIFGGFPFLLGAQVTRVFSRYALTRMGWILQGNPPQ